MNFSCTYQLNDITQIGKHLLALYPKQLLYCFEGSLGAGKTTLIKVMLGHLGVEERQMSSPTFPIVNEYISTTTEDSIYHMDFYRLEAATDTLFLDLEDKFANHYCFVEWPKFTNLFTPYHPIWIKLLTSADAKNERQLVATSSINHSKYGSP